MRILAGSDAGSQSLPFGSLHRELTLLLSAGCPTREALLAATFSAGVALGRHDLGTVQQGAVADVLVWNGNPFEDLAALRQPVLVTALSITETPQVERGGGTPKSTTGEGAPPMLSVSKPSARRSPLPGSQGEKTWKSDALVKRGWTISAIARKFKLALLLADSTTGHRIDAGALGDDDSEPLRLDYPGVASSGDSGLRTTLTTRPGTTITRRSSLPAIS